MYECSRSLLIVGEPFVSRAEQTLNVRSTRASFVDLLFDSKRLSVYVETYVLLPASSISRIGRSQRMLRL